jgi:N-acetylglucosaminyldiphosphoundecaprenol N-acetyl-beta-D-mannosaminyltransferase
MNTEPYRKFSLGVIQCSLHSIPQLLDELDGLLTEEADTRRTVLCVNAHIYNLAVRDKELRRCLNEARICAADGMAVVWAARAFGVRLEQRCNMTEAFRAFLNQERGPQIEAILIGCTPAEASAASETINSVSTRCRVSLACSGFLSTQEYRSLLATRRDARLVLVGMGTPRSEVVAEIAAEICARAVVWHIGGGTIRILAGTMQEAPAAWRRLGIQWLHRLVNDPIRFWYRYLIGNPLFASRILIAGISGRVGALTD